VSLNKAITALVFVIFVMNCNKEINEPISKSGHLAVYLSDAPGDYSEVNITFSEIDVHIDSEWISILTEQKKVNLLEWNNGRSMVLGEADVPAGLYSQIRLKIEKADVVYNGQNFPMDVPSGATTGLKFGPSFSVESGSSYELMLDFDADRSVVSTGPPKDPRGFKLKPHIRAVPMAITGSISGRVTNPQHVPIAYAIQGSDTLTSSRVDTLTGNFKIGFLENGSYKVAIEDTLNFKYTQTDVKVVAGHDVNLGEVTLKE
jgi:hypothetical protein